MLEPLRAFNRVTHPRSGGGYLRAFLLLALCATNPVGHALIVFAVVVNLFLWLVDLGKPKRPRNTIPADAPEMIARRAAREERSYRAEPRKRPRVQEPHLSREEYEVRLRESMRPRSSKPSYDFESTAVEEPLLALSQHT